MRFDINVDGDKELQRALLNLPAALETKVLRAAIRDGARPILEQSKSNIRSLRVTGEHTGPLERGMKIRALPRKRGRFGVAVQTPTRDELGIAPDSRWYYPAHIELGTKNAPAQPYLRNALESQRATVIQRIRQAILNGIERIVKAG